MQAQFKKETGLEYKPGMAPPSSAAAPQADSSSCPYTRVTQQGELVRKLKAEQAPKVHGHYLSFLISCSLLAACSRPPSAGPPIVPVQRLPVIFTSLLLCVEFCDKTLHVFMHAAHVLVIASAPTIIFVHAELFSGMPNRSFFKKTPSTISWFVDGTRTRLT